MNEPDKQGLENQWLHNWQPTDKLQALAAQVATIINDPSLSETEKQTKVNALIN